jgi:hypothetical protein
MGKRDRAEAKGKEENDKLIGNLKGVALSASYFCWIENRLVSSCLCSAVSTSVVAAIAVGVLGAFAPETELGPLARRGGAVWGLINAWRVGRAGPRPSWAPSLFVSLFAHPAVILLILYQFGKERK